MNIFTMTVSKTILLNAIKSRTRFTFDNLYNTFSKPYTAQNRIDPLKINTHTLHIKFRKSAQVTQSNRNNPQNTAHRKILLRRIFVRFPRKIRILANGAVSKSFVFEFCGGALCVSIIKWTIRKLVRAPN